MTPSSQAEVEAVREGTATAADLSAALGAMEVDRRLAGTELAASTVAVAVILGRPDLLMRARLVHADALIRSGSTTEALQTVTDVREQALAARDRFVVARSHFLESILLSMQGAQADAAHHACLAVDDLPDSVPAPVRARHLVTLALSVDDLRLGDGLPYYQEALDIAAATGDAQLSVSVLSNLVWNELEVDDVDAAWALVVRMRRIADYSSVPMRAADLETIARVELRRGDPAAAELVLRPLICEPPEVVLTELSSLPAGLLVMATAQRQLGDLEGAQRSLQRAAALCAASGLAQLAADVSEEQSHVHAAAGRFEQAFKEYVRFHAASAALVSADREERARATQLAFASREGQREDARYREWALRDPLTGLYNRRFVGTQLPELIEGCGAARPVSVAIIDIDFFKRVNDTLSHDTGDLVLRQVALLLSGAVTEPATAARLGGEEFLLVWPETDAASALVGAEAVRRTVEEHDWTALVGAMPITISVGVASTADAATLQGDLLHQADENLYAAKHAGRNQVVGLAA